MARSSSTRPSLQEEARALGDPTRHAIFTLLVESGCPLGVGELTERFDLNHNAIRQHLAKLVGAGLVTESRAPADGPGRPRNVYTVSPAVAGRWGSDNPYEALSRMLAEIITSGDSPEDVGRRSGEAMAAEIAAMPGDPLTALVEVMARQGFEPALDDDVEDAAEVVLHHCPFAATAAEARETVCSLHLGLAEGLVDRSDLSIDELLAHDPASADCRLRITRRRPVPEPSRLVLGRHSERA